MCAALANYTFSLVYVVRLSFSHSIQGDTQIGTLSALRRYMFVHI